MEKVGIIMGSDSDLPTMAETAKILELLGIDYEMTIVSAHRTPDRMADYAKKARSRGIEVIVAGAGGAAHLPGMTASMTSLPVVGVPIGTKMLNGFDSLLSIVQMPGGIPVAAVAVDGGRNAGLLAARILSIKYPGIVSRLEEYAKMLEREVEEKAARLEKIGYGDYSGTYGNP